MPRQPEDCNEEVTATPEPVASGDLLRMMADGFQASNPTLQSSVPEAGAPEHSASEAEPAALPERPPRKAIISIHGEDVEEIEIEHAQQDDERAA